ncbi:MAG: restriction endonuclease subunit S [Methylococcales bacterium]|nr:restriction endonuclease subunit S [Methylococcales bacterium]
MNHGLSEKTVNKIFSVFERFPEVEKAVLYGSRAKGNFKTGSDIDLTLYGEKLSARLLGDIAEALDDLLLPYTIDLSIFDDLNHAKLREHIERVGVVFYEKKNQNMKAGWEIKKLRDVCLLINGRAYNKPELLPEGKYPVLRVGNLFTNNHWYYSDMELDEDKYCENGDLLYAWSASFSPFIWDGEKAIFHYHIWKVQPNSEVIDKKFLYMWFFWDVEQIKQDHGTGTTMIHVSKGSMEEREISLPPLPEQKRLVTLLDEAFESIATAKANAQQNLKNARALFESHLNEVFTKRGEGWEEKTLGEVCELLNGFAFKSSDVVQESETQLVRMGNLYGNKLNLERSPVFYPDNFAEDYQKYTLNEGDLIMSLTGTTGKEDYGYTVKIPECNYALLMNQRIAKFDQIKENLVNRDYLEHYLRSRVFLDVLYSTANGTRQANLSSVVIKTLPIPLCSISEQKEIASSLESLAEETQRLESLYSRKIAALDELKKALLHRALVGSYKNERSRNQSRTH